MPLLLVIRYPEEGPGLMAWGRRAAMALEEPMEVVVCDPEGPQEGIGWEEERGERPVFLDGLEQDERWGRVRMENAAGALAEASVQAKFMLIGKHNSGRGDNDSPERRLSRAVFDQARCAVGVLRLPEENRDWAGKVLVPCAGGPHSRAALRLAEKLAGQGATAFFVEPDVDEVSREVGERLLKKAIKRAGVDPDAVTCKVALGEKVSDEIRKEAEGGDYELLIIGASNTGTLRAKLFGTVPDRLLRGPGGLALAVVRAAPPKGHQLREALGRFMRLKVPQLERDERVALVDEVEGKARWTFDFAALMVLATSIAALGLLADSVAVVIGAMLVAPLMTPLIGGGLALVQGNWPLWRRSQWAVLMGFFAALGIGILAGFGARLLGFGLTGELAARGEPTLLDLGVAFISGVAASYCLARPSLSGALAGVAIAAALVPPIATVGICLSLGETETSRGAALLFGTNVVAIVLGAAGNFYLAGIRGQQAGGVWARRLFITLALACAGLAVPLTSVLVGKVTEPRLLEQRLQAVADNGGYRLLKLRRTREAGDRLVELELAGPAAAGDALVSRLRAAAEDEVGHPVRVRVRTLLEREEVGDSR
ncbi:hypothetical protein HAHE_16390 [Haloferula helveola]|uniref:TIGR00341 family protein n=1 Tax=Haloferula helveola TaxID=490095 RepID=A0ABM7RKY7_9BACT|nr:hypothetical protein HAHE_16390 [Haloferula helveola]